MSLLVIPIELLEKVADHLHPGDVSSLMATSQKLHYSLSRYLFRIARHYKRPGHESLTRRLKEVSFYFDKEGNGTVLEWAAIHGQIRTFERLVVDSGVDVILRDSYGVTLLHRLAAHGLVQFMRPLILRLKQSREELSDTDLSALTPLHFAAGCNMQDAVKLLLKSGAKLSAKDLHGNTPLHIAAVNGSCSVLTTLANAGIDVNSETKCGWTAIDQASIGHKTKAVQILLYLGSRPPSWENRQNALTEYVYLAPRPWSCSWNTIAGPDSSI
jgi:hypothetical protein